MAQLNCFFSKVETTWKNQESSEKAYIFKSVIQATQDQF